MISVLRPQHVETDMLIVLMSDSTPEKLQDHARRTWAENPETGEQEADSGDRGVSAPRKLTAILREDPVVGGVEGIPRHGEFAERMRPDMNDIPDYLIKTILGWAVDRVLDVLAYAVRTLLMAFLGHWGSRLSGKMEGRLAAGGRTCPRPKHARSKHARHARR